MRMLYTLKAERRHAALSSSTQREQREDGDEPTVIQIVIVPSSI
jgi:hypothetical protein